MSHFCVIWWGQRKTLLIVSHLWNNPFQKNSIRLSMLSNFSIYSRKNSLRLPLTRYARALSPRNYFFVDEHVMPCQRLSCIPLTGIWLLAHLMLSVYYHIWWWTIPNLGKTTSTCLNRGYNFFRAWQTTLDLEPPSSIKCRRILSFPSFLWGNITFTDRDACYSK